MIKRHVIRRAIKLSVLALIGTGVICLDTESSFAQARHQVSAMCRDRVNAKGVKGDNWKTEYQKCKADPENYK
jgi:hypothetical protein